MEIKSSAELSRDLALALGWSHVEILPRGDVVVVGIYSTSMHFKDFDYRDPTVCLPLIEWLGRERRIFFWFCAPTSTLAPRWASSGFGVVSPTLPEAVARAVIAVKGST